MHSFNTKKTAKASQGHQRFILEKYYKGANGK